MESSKLDKTILEMLRDGEEFCRHPYHAIVSKHVGPTNTALVDTIVVCAVCMTTHKLLSYDFTSAWQEFRKLEQPKFDRYDELKEFWDMCIHYGWKPEYIPNLLKGQPMSTDDYKRGVLDATVRISDAEGSDFGFYNEKAGYLNDLLSQRRKKLLTKKVTKWANVYSYLASVSDPANVKFGGASLYDTKETAEKYAFGTIGLIGTYPIEIEVEI